MRERQINEETLKAEKDLAFFEGESSKYAGLYRRVFRALDEKIRAQGNWFISKNSDWWNRNYLIHCRGGGLGDEEKGLTGYRMLYLATGRDFSLETDDFFGSIGIVVVGQARNWSTGKYFFNMVRRGLRVDTHKLQDSPRAVWETNPPVERSWHSRGFFEARKDREIIDVRDTEKNLEALLEEIKEWQPVEISNKLGC